MKYESRQTVATEPLRLPASLRARLILWVVGIVTTVLLIVCAILFLTLRAQLDASVNAALQRQSAQLVGAIGISNGQFDVQLTNDGTSPVGEPTYRLWNAQGAPSGASSDATAFPATPDALRAALIGQATFQTIQVGQAHVRVYTMPIRASAVAQEDGAGSQAGNVVGVLQVALPLGANEAAMQHLIMLMALLVPGAMVLAAAGGWILASQALSPIARITRMAGELSASDLSLRIPPAPRDDEIGRLVTTLNGMLGRLDAAFRRQRQFTADASHELRSPLATIIANLELIRAGTAHTPAQNTLEYTLGDIKTEAERMRAIVNDLLLLARADANQITIEREPVAMDELVLDVVAQRQARARHKGLRLTAGRVSPSQVLGEDARLIQVLLNLVDNALAYTPPGGLVALSVETEGAWAEVRVRDTGIGIGPEDLPRIFERFYRADPARARDSGGSGLGLAICAWIVEAHGGTITATSAPGQGSTFTARLPLAHPTSEARPARRASPRLSLRQARKLTHW